MKRAMSDANALFIPQHDDIDHLDEPAMTRAALACIDGFTASPFKVFVRQTW